ncbi:glycosyltransferase family 4 protein [Candidatus Thioglobus sp.]|nr:glycosyltransferase family 4 protein [Candidatus Thioglobus sp.]
MKIGVDVRSLSEPIDGIGRYTLCLLEEMTLNNDHEWILYSHKPILHGKWDMLNVSIRTMNPFIKFKGIYFVWLQFILPFWLKRDQIDLFWTPAHRLPKFMPSSILKVITIHDLVWRHFPETMKPLGRALDSMLMPYSIRSADKIIASSRSTANQIIEEQVKAKDKTSVVYLANSIELKKQISKFDTTKNDFILFVGTIEPRKNLRRLLEAYSLLSISIRNKHPLVIVGAKGWGNENINLIIEKLNLKKFVKVLGFITNQELAKIYSQAHLFVMPSLYEGFGLPVLEAMSFGIPVVTSNNYSLPEVVGDTAILVNPKSVSSIKNGMEEGLLDLKLRHKLSKSTFERSKLFSWKKASKETIKVFEQALSDRYKLIK